ncbi:MAG: hypothetical protein E7527_01565 [Ruminococcaceae bacterium]|nr:hypothetical protein [Oscillospiraceae bacterium]
MSARETNFHHTSSNSTYWRTFDECIKFATRIRAKVWRLCEKKDYSCLGIMGISENDKDQGSVQVGYRGYKRFVGNSKQVYKTNPHIHMVTLANPGESISRQITSWFTHNSGGKNAFHNNCNHYLPTAVHYLMAQSKKFRTVMYNVDKLPKEDVYTFCWLVEKENVQMGGVKPIFKGLSDEIFYSLKNNFDGSQNEVFTNDYDEDTLKPLDITGESAINTPSETLQCNICANNYTNYTHYTGNTCHYPQLSNPFTISLSKSVHSCDSIQTNNTS